MIPYGRQNIGEDDIAALMDVFKTEWLTTGPFVSEFENAFSSYVHSKEAVAVNSGTSALDIAIQALDLPKGSEVITTPFTFVATSNAILYNGLIPVFADISPYTRNINFLEIEQRLTPKTSAILYVDYAGNPCNINEIKNIAASRNLKLIEDACHALGAEYHLKKIGSLADVTAFSFHPVKHITTGEGGMVTTNDEEIGKKLRMLRNHGIDSAVRERTGYSYDMLYLGRNYRMTDFQAALGTSQLKKIESFIERRQHIAEMYNDLLSPLSDIVSTPTASKGSRHAWHLYTVLIDNRDKIFKMMRNRGIGVNVHYIPIYRFSYYKKRFDIPPKRYAETEYVFSKILTLPLHPGMMDAHVGMVVDELKDCIKQVKI
jgi:UDP-4-amino-4,6-dideoxy-N-acetyl-beta-L-altrosamine transaminase